MRIETKEIEIFKFDELPKDVQEKIIENWRIDDDFSHMHECVFDDFILKMEEYDIVIEKSDIEYTGFCSQGDGARFQFSLNESEIISFIENMSEKENYKNLYETLKNDNMELTICTVKNSYGYHYYHERTLYVDSKNLWIDSEISEEKEDIIYQEIESLCEDINAWRIELSNELYNDLYNTYEYWCSEECIKEEIEANEYEFTIDGNIY